MSSNPNIATFRAIFYVIIFLCSVTSSKMESQLLLSLGQPFDPAWPSEGPDGPEGSLPHVWGRGSLEECATGLKAPYGKAHGILNTGSWLVVLPSS